MMAWEHQYSSEGWQHPVWWVICCRREEPSQITDFNSDFQTANMTVALILSGGMDKIPANQHFVEGCPQIPRKCIKTYNFKGNKTCLMFWSGT